MKYKVTLFADTNDRKLASSRVSGLFFRDKGEENHDLGRALNQAAEPPPQRESV